MRLLILGDEHPIQPRNGIGCSPKPDHTSLDMMEVSTALSPFILFANLVAKVHDKVYDLTLKFLSQCVI